MVAMCETYCVVPKNGNKPCGNVANGGTVFVGRYGYPVCKECWDFGHKIRQIIVEWPRRNKLKDK